MLRWATAGGRCPPQARAESHPAVRPVPGRAGARGDQGRVRAHGVHRGPPARRAAGRLAGRVEPRRSRSASCCAPASRSSTPTTTASTRSPTSAASARTTTPSCVGRRLVEQVRAQLVDDAALLVTADHGQVDVGDQRSSRSPTRCCKLTRCLSGEGRFRWLHARPGAADDLLDAATAAHGDVAWVISRQELIDDGWFGPVVSPPIAARFGDVALVPQIPISFVDPADSGPFRWCVATARSHLLRCSCRCWPADREVPQFDPRSTDVDRDEPHDGSTASRRGAADA